MRCSNSLKWLAAFAALAVGTADLAAQSSATLMGRITDETGAAVSGAQIVITNQVTGAQNGGLSQADGRYSVAGLRAGGGRPSSRPGGGAGRSNTHLYRRSGA